MQFILRRHISYNESSELNYDLVEAMTKRAQTIKTINKWGCLFHENQNLKLRINVKGNGMAKQDENLVESGWIGEEICKIMIVIV